MNLTNNLAITVFQSMHLLMLVANYPDIQIIIPGLILHVFIRLPMTDH